MNTGKLFVIPSLFSIKSDKNLIPSYIINNLNKIDEFIVENEKKSRAFLRKILSIKSEDNFVFHTIGKHSNSENLNKILNNCHKGINIGLLSDLGCPSIADPGSNVVQIAHQNNIKVIPLIGPSSIFLALMASGLNGQNFTFHGYLPVNNIDLLEKIKKIEKKSINTSQTQIFIETPFRNNKVFSFLTKYLRNSTKLCVAKNITLNDEVIYTQKVSQWKKNNYNFNKKLCVFLLNGSND